MMNHRLCPKGFRMRVLLALLVLMLCFSAVARGANNFTGAVRNESRGEPSVGDEVILVRLDGRTAEARTKTDRQGTFALNPRYPDKSYVVRVLHQGVSYDQQVSPGQSLFLEVFDTAAKVRGITGTIEILRTATNGNRLHVSDLIEIKNSSRPPLTRAGERTFEVYLPGNAVIDSVLAAGPGSMGGTISAAAVPGEPGHYTVNFPLRPGATKFAFNYDVPYQGQAAFHPKLVFPVQQFAVMIPLAMKFSSRSHAFKILATDNSRYQVRAASQVKAGAGPEFELSETGTLPPLADQGKTQALSPPAPRLRPALTAPAGTTPLSAAPIDRIPSPSQPVSQGLVLGGVTSLLLVASALLVWRGRKTLKFSGAPTVALRHRQRQHSSP